jgi:GNAT superfamily N-acetyltransferase
MRAARDEGTAGHPGRCREARETEAAPPPAEIRVARPADAPAVAEVHVRSWQAGYRGLLPDAYLDSLRPEDRAARYTFDRGATGDPETIVALVEGVIRGFATTGPARGVANRDVGEVLALYVDPHCWGRGLGRRLIVEARRRLTAHGFPEAILWVLAGNARAERFYRADGWLPDGARREAETWGVRAEEVRYVRTLRS